MSARDLNADLVGVPESRAKVQTPALVIDLDVLERNIAHMAEFAASRAASSFARMPRRTRVRRSRDDRSAAGALGVCRLKLGEAEVLADAGIENLLITSPVVTDKGIEQPHRLECARERSDGDSCDNPEVAARLEAAAKASGKTLKIVVDIDPGA